MTGLTGTGPSFRSVIRRTVLAAERLNLFFLAGAVSFSILLAGIPFLFLLLGLAGFLLPLIEDPQGALLAFLLDTVPNSAAGGGPVELFDRVVGGLVRDRTGVSLLGSVLFVWFSTRLVGTVRTVLRQIFEIQSTKGVIYAKLFDAAVVLAATALISVNLAVTVFVRTWGSERMARLGLESGALSVLEMLLVRASGFIAIWVLCLLVYRFLADGRVPWRTALVAATSMALLHEALKFAFGWYLTSLASYTSVYGTLANLAVVLFWIFYTSTAFVLSGVFAHAWAERIS